MFLFENRLWVGSIKINGTSLKGAIGKSKMVPYENESQINTITYCRI